MTEDNDFASADWSEPWLERPIAVPAHAALSTGRLLNCFSFHAQQAWLLYYPGQEEKWRSQYDCSLRVLDEMVKVSHDVDASDQESLRHATQEARHEWDAEFQHPQHARTLDEAMTRYEEREGEWCFADAIKFAVEIVDDKPFPSFRQAVSDSLSEQDRSYFWLGESLDQGVRPPHISLHLQPSSEEREAELSDLLDSKQGRGDLDTWKVGDTREPHFPPNTLARCSRAPGEYRPNRAWWGDFRGFLKDAGIAVKVPDRLSKALSEATQVGILELVDKLDQAIRHALNPGPPEIAVIRATHSVEAGDRTCIFRSDTAEFRFVALLIAKVGNPVPYLKIAEKAMAEGEKFLEEVKAEREKECNVIRRLKRRVCMKLKKSGMADVADAIKSEQKGYKLSWPPSRE